MDALNRGKPRLERLPGLVTETGYWPHLPDESPLAMPIQSLRAWRGRRLRRLPSSPRFTVWRRLFVFGGGLGLTAFATYQMYDVLSVAGLTNLEIGLIVLFAVVFGWIALAFVSALAGFCVLMRGGSRRLGIDPGTPLPALEARTALLMPTYNEAPERVIAGLEAMYRSLEDTGRIAAFDLFILSDTTDPDVWVAEESAFLGLRERTRGHARIFYRRRPKNLERKAGNIADWCRRWGGAYEHMLVLDADSLMTGDAIVRLAAAMEAHPDVGLIQTLPLIVNRNTLFARLQQFAGRIYGPMVAAGIAWWHGADGNYWGHNAIIRTRAFVDTAGLPHIKGKPPFGGHILSHDFVEAALLRRAGWAVHLVPQLGGSYEESPPSLLDLAVRDRRWCQGNLQHMAVLPAKGLYWTSRVHLLMGIMSYLASPLWLLFLVGGMLLALQARFFRPEYFTSEFSLFPVWPAIDPVRAAWLFAGSMFVLLAPKLLGYIHAMTRPELRHGSGGFVGAFLSMILETLISGLIAPVMMVIQSVAVFEILTGRAVGWNPQRRDDGSISLGEVARRHLKHTLFGFILAGCAYAVSPLLFLWMTPVIVGLVVAIPLSALTARRDLGRRLRRRGLLLIPEEVKPPRVITLANVLTRQLQAEAPAEREAVRRLARNPDLLAAHLAMLPPKPQRRRCEIDVDLVTGLAKAAEALTLEEALQALTPKEKAAVLADAGGTERLVGLARSERQGEPALALA